MTFLLSFLYAHPGTIYTLCSQLILLPCIPLNNSQFIHNSRNWSQQRVSCHSLPELFSLNPRAKLQTQKEKENPQYKTPPSKNLQITPHTSIKRKCWKNEDKWENWASIYTYCLFPGGFGIVLWYMGMRISRFIWGWERNNLPTPQWSLHRPSPAQVPHSQYVRGQAHGQPRKARLLLNNLGIKTSVSIIMNTW